MWTNKRQLSAAAIAAALTITAIRAEQFSFGVIADVQYADQDRWSAREYRRSIPKLEQCVALMNQEQPAFVIQLGDLIDGGVANIDPILKIYNRMPPPVYHVLGNHDLSVERSVLLQRLGMSKAYYQFSVRGWRFIVLDGMNESVAGGWPESDPHAAAGRKWLERLSREGAVNAQTWDGALGEEQRNWLRATLREAGERHERAIVFSHFPVLPESCRPEHLLWDYREVLEILSAQPAVAAYINGHDHKGGYGKRGGIHFITVPAIVEHEANQSCQVVDVHPDGLEVRQAGQKTGRVFDVK